MKTTETRRGGGRKKKKKGFLYYICTNSHIHLPSFLLLFFFVAWSLHRHMNLATTWVTRSSIASFTFFAVLALVS